ncbi:MAG: type II and III secretion system protein [Treponemataceae bacterium]|nr:type II and III secretion system protein [Treponemataceae bacterium]
MKKLRKKSLVMVLFCCFVFMLPSQTGFDFSSQDISEIVYAVSLARSFPIICDDTVSGTASFRFAAGDFNTAFDSFLLANRLYVLKEESRWIVSRIRIIHRDDGLMDIDAYDLPAEKIFERLSAECTVPVLYDALPSSPLSVHLSGVEVCSAVAVIMRRFEGYSVSYEDNCVAVEKKIQESFYPPVVDDKSRIEISLSDGLFSAELSNAEFPQIIERIAELSGIEFCSLVKNSSYIIRVSFQNEPFNKALEIICANSDVGFRCVENLYLFFTMPDAGRKFREEEKKWFVFTTDYISSGEACRLMKLRFPDTEFSEISAARFMCSTTEAALPEMSAYLSLCDASEKTFLISLKYIRTDDFLANLPPGYSASSFKKTGSSDALFYTGTDKTYEKLCSLTEYIDKPADMLSYDLLIVQAQKSVSSDWSSAFETSRLTPGDSNGFHVGIAPSFKFNIDIVAAFGYSFSAKLQAAVSENKAKIFADTTLYGVSGVPISFRNTNTYRYRDPNLDADTGKTLNGGVTREIVSGLVLDITGWLSGDGMITTSVTASYSRQGVDTSSTGNPPPTSEKIVTTQVRGRSGEVIVLSGLIQNDESSSSTKTPFFSSIPVLGWLFKAEDKTEEDNELTIYLIPRISAGSEQKSGTGGGASYGDFVQEDHCGGDAYRDYIKSEIRQVVQKRRQRNAGL